MNSNKIRYLVVSDVHLGATGCWINELKNFLTDIKTNKFGSVLKALLILGDFYDLCLETYQNLAVKNKYLEIYHLLEEIHNRNIKIINVLGNHEVPITGSFNKKFFQRKNFFFTKFSSRFSEIPNFFDQKFLCQYLLITEENQTFKIIPIDDIRNFKLLDEQPFCLLTHGYQFDPKNLKWVGGHIWKALINSDNENIKHAFDKLWNGMKSGALIKMAKKIDLEQYKIDENTIVRLNNLALTLYDSETARKREMVVTKGLFSRYDKLLKFLTLYGLQDINYIIYGHTHDWDMNFNVYNDGAWQHVKPTYIEIYESGAIEIKSYPNVNAI